jgi:hypothetical protein
MVNQPSSGSIAINKAAESPSPEVAYLRRVSRLVTTVSEFVQAENLSPLRHPRWAVPKERFSHRAGKWLHWLYASTDDALPIPTRLGLTLGLFLSLSFEQIYPAIYFISLKQGLFPPVTWGSILARAIIFLMLLLVLYSAVGAYWTLSELVIINRRLAWWLRLLIVVAVVISVGAWIAMGAPLIGHNPVVDDASLSQAIAAMRQSQTYLFIAALCFYIPAISHAVLWLTRTVALFTIYVVSIYRWFFRYHKMETFAALDKTLLRPLPLIEGEKPQSLLELQEMDIAALHEWAVCRRQIVQNRLLPTTLLLAALGLLANTSLGESAVQGTMSILGKYLMARGMVDWTAGIGVIVLLMIVIGLPIAIVVKLLNEAFVMDYIAEACVLARQAKVFSQKLSSQEQTNSEPDAPPPAKRHSWLQRLLGRG